LDRNSRSGNSPSGIADRAANATLLPDIAGAVASQTESEPGVLG
jgi:hypothetical protein